MTRLIWGAVGSRFFETGVDRGVLYVDGEGHAWGGLVSVDESSSGGGAKSYYLDGIKYLNISSREEFQATITAFYSPPQFDACDGTLSLRPGLFVTQQRRKPFDFCYRTLVGNDVEGTNKGYKLHLIYNALAAPSSRTYSSLSDSPEAEPLSWSITTKPVPIPEAAPGAHLVVDTSTASPYSVQTLEEILYGNALNAPRMPTPEELVLLFTDASPFTVTDNGDDTFTISGSDLAVRMIDVGKYEIVADTVIPIDENTAEISSE